MKQREIKFRTWDKKNKNWLSGFEANRKICGWENNETGSFVYIRNEYFGVNQYTGLKDKNGKEIYEGDIVEYKKHIAKVSWNKLAAGFWFEGDIDLRDKTIKASETKVIGNIFENKELIK